MTRENLSIVRNTCPNANFCTIISTLPGPGSNPGLCNERQGTTYAMVRPILNISANLWSQKKMGTIIAVELTAHHTPCNGFLWINI